LSAVQQLVDAPSKPANVNIAQLLLVLMQVRAAEVYQAIAER
jgi:hypothetical protein